MTRIVERNNGLAEGVVGAVTMMLLAELGRFAALGMVTRSGTQSRLGNRRSGAGRIRVRSADFQSALGAEAPACGRSRCDVGGLLSSHDQSRLETGAPARGGFGFGAPIFNRLWARKHRLADDCAVTLDVFFRRTIKAGWKPALRRGAHSPFWVHPCYPAIRDYSFGAGSAALCSLNPIHCT